MNTALQPDEFVLLIDRSGRHFLTRLREQGQFQCHQGILQHAAMVGQVEGTRLETSLGRPMWIFRPRLQDYLMEMPRSSTIVYPKDIGILLVWADIFPGARVLEAGAGSGALSMALLRAIGPTGQLITCDIRSDMIERARKNVANLLGPTPNWSLQLGDVYQETPGGPFDRMVLDLPEPGLVAPHAARVLVPGGILCSFVPNVPQVQMTVDAYRKTHSFVQIETFEAQVRPWIFRGPTARPSHSSVSHTGFLTFARRGDA
ncbi:MAG: tRNA (adenine-N1)-methyltransferase [Chloroflexi bacterium]|nr:tRNA (adenine-N1)-methyltransferase [Chloroflexota bacterium]